MIKQQDRRLKRQTSLSSKDSNHRSAVFVALLLGLIFCLANVAVILWRIDYNESFSSESSSADAVLHSKLTIIDNILPQAADTNIQHSKIRVANADWTKDKEPILQILREAGIHDIDDDTMQRLPTWTQVTNLYGDKPRIYGLESCQTFQNQSDPAEHFVGTAGTFNSGTNLMSELMIHNCHMPKRMEKYGLVNKGIRWQVPWGKHTPVKDEDYRLTHKSEKDQNIDATNILPAVTIRDPYVWMQSMCRIHYKAFWAHDTKSPDKHCPNLIPNEADVRKFPWLQEKDAVPIRVKYQADFVRHHASLVHFWNDWYSEYVQASFPRIIVRFEDLVFHAKDVTTAVCHCAGGEMNKGPFQYIVDSAKKGEGAHGKDRTSFIDAIVRYGKDTHRLDSMTSEDLEFARKSLDPMLMEFFDYQYDEIGRGKSLQ